MSDITLDKVNSLPDFLTDERFEVSFSKMPAVSGVTADDINLRTVSFTPPKTAITPVEFTLHTFKKSQPATRQPDDTLTITLVEAIDMKTYNFIKSWRDLCVERNTHKVGDVNSREAEILVYHKDNTSKTVWNYKIIKAWLQSYTLPDFADGSSPAAVTSSLTLKFSDFIDGTSV